MNAETFMFGFVCVSVICLLLAYACDVLCHIRDEPRAIRKKL
jgi:hypothetical protein